MNIDLKCLRETIVEEKVTSIPSRTVLTLLDHIDRLERERNLYREDTHRLLVTVIRLKDLCSTTYTSLLNLDPTDDEGFAKIIGKLDDETVLS